MNARPNRRRVLLGLAAASTAAAAPASAAGAAKESPELIALGDGLGTVLERYKAASAHRRDIVRAANGVWPRAPEEITCYSQGSKMEASITGAGISRKWSEYSDIKRVRNYGTPSCFAQKIKSTEKEIARIKGTKSKRGLRFQIRALEDYQKALPLSEAYCAEIDRVTRESGYEAADRAMVEARDALKAHVGAIVNSNAQTMEGVVIQAQALQAWQAVDGFTRTMDLDAMQWPAKMAASVLRLGGSA